MMPDGDDYIGTRDGRQLLTEHAPHPKGTEPNDTQKRDGSVRSSPPGRCVRLCRYLSEDLDGASGRPRGLSLRERGTDCGKRVLLQTIVTAVLLALLWAAPCPAADTCFAQGAKEIGRETGRAVREGTEEVGRKIKEDATQVSKEVSKGLTETKREAQKTGRTVGEWFRDAGKKIGGGFRQMGRDIRKFFTGK
jgi:hypothetical protein